MALDALFELFVLPGIPSLVIRFLIFVLIGFLRVCMFGAFIRFGIAGWSSGLADCRTADPARTFALGVGGHAMQIHDNAERKNECDDFLHDFILLIYLLTEAKSDTKEQRVQVVTHAPRVTNLKIHRRPQTDSKPC